MKFYYLREFRKENGFNKIDLCERMILSALLTSKITGDERDLVDIIMNFDDSQSYTSYTNWKNYKDFAEVITKFLKEEKGYISDFICKHYDDIDEKGNRTFYYVSFDYSDLDIHHKNSMLSIACKAFILSCANHAVYDNNDWFEFNICNWSKYAMNQRKRTLEEINEFMHKHDISYFVQGNKIKIDNKIKQDKNKKVNEEKEIIHNVLSKKETAVKKEEKLIGKPDPVVPEYTEDEDIVEDEETNDLDSLIITEEDIDDILNLDKDKRFKNFKSDRSFTIDDLNKIYEYEKNFDHNFIQNRYTKYENYFKSESKKPDKVLQSELNEFELLYPHNFLTKYKNLNNFINNKFTKDKYGDIKDAAREELKILKDKVCVALTKLYDKDKTQNKNVYKFIVFWTLKTHKKILSMNF